ncbi:MAG: SDR family oxidoreductase [Planctomycetota bacterium]|jgi:3-oxoacyl-[acyl-carrier protein] reductase
MTTDDALPLKGLNALACGSTQGIGRACAHAFARGGATVTLLARHATALGVVRDELPAPCGQTHHAVQADFADWAAVRDAAAAHLRAHGPAHVLLNNTGGPPAGQAIAADPEAFGAAMSQHLLCFQALVQLTAPGMREAGYGRIVNIISTSVVQPIRGLGISNAVRGAVANWGRTLAAELGPHGITVNNVLPGYTRTARLDAIIAGRAQRAGVGPDEIEAGMVKTVPAGRFGTADEVAAVAAFLASPAAAYVNGVNLPVDGGRLASQ